jgi:hypothetical protein
MVRFKFQAWFSGLADDEYCSSSSDPVNQQEPRAPKRRKKRARQVSSEFPFLPSPPHILFCYPRFPPPHRLAKIDEINSPPPLPPSDRTIQLSRTPNMERSSSLSSSPYSSWNPSPIAATSSGGTLGSASAGATPAPRTNRQGNGFSDLARFVSDEGTTASGDSSALGSARRERRNSTTAISSYAEPALRT